MNTGHCSVPGVYTEDCKDLCIFRLVNNVYLQYLSLQETEGNLKICSSMGSTNVRLRFVVIGSSLELISLLTLLQIYLSIYLYYWQIYSSTYISILFANFS